MSYSAGEATVQIVPSLRGFSRTLNRDLGRINAELGVAITLPQATTIGADLQAKLSRINAEIGVKVKADTSAFSRDLSASLSRINSSVSVRIAPDLTGFSTAVSSALGRMRNGGMKVKVDPDVTSLQRDLEAKVAALGGLTIKAKVDLDDAAAKAALASLTRPQTVEINAKVDKKSGLGGAGGGGGGIGGGGLDFNIGGLAKAGAMINGITAAAPAAIGAIGGLGVGLLGVGAAAGPALAAVALGMDGIKAAAATIAPQFDALKATVSSAFQDSMAPAFAQLGGLMDSLGPGFAAIATSIGGVFGEITDVLTSAGPQISTILEGASQFVSAMGPGISALVQGFVDLGTAAAPAMAMLGSALGDLFAFIGETFSKLAANGVLTTLFEGLASVISSLAVVVAPLLEMMATLGAIILPPLASILSIVGGLLDDLLPAFSQIAGAVGGALVAVFQALAPAITSLVNALAPVITMLVDALAPVVAQLLPILSDVAAIIGQTLGQALAAIAPAIPPLAEAFKAILAAVAPLIPVLAQGLAGAVQAIAPAIQMLAEGIGAALVPIMPVLTDLFAQLQPVIAQVAQVMGGVLLSVVQAIAPVIPVLAQAFMTLINALLPILPVITNLAQTLLPIFADVLMQIIPVVAELYATLWTALGTAIQQLAPLIGPLVNAVLQLLQAFLPLLPVILDLALQMLPPLVQILLTLVPIITNVITAITPWISQIIQLLIPALQQLSTDTGNVFQFIADFITKTVETVKGIFTGLKDAFAAVGQFFQDTWNNVIRPAWDALGSGIRWVIDNAITPAFDALKGGLQSVQDFFGSIVGGIKNVWNGLVDTLRTPINFVISRILNDGLGGAWNAVSGLLGLDPWTNINEVAPIAMAKGGPVTGGVPGKDSVPIMGMGGEFMLSRPAVQAAGVDNLTAFNNAALRGSRPSTEGMVPITRRDQRAYVPGMASGGLVNDAVNRAIDFARQQDGKPYEWAGPTGPGSSFDCSGFMGSIAAVINGTNPWQRYWSTEDGGGLRNQGFVPGLGAGFSVGLLHGGSGGGHTAGTLGGLPGIGPVNVESGGSHGNVAFGGPAAGADSGQFTEQWHLPISGDAFTSAGMGGGSGGGGFMAWIRGKIADLFEVPVKALRNIIPSFDEFGSFGKTPLGLYDNLSVKAIDFIRGKANSSSGAGDPGGTDVERWRPILERQMRAQGFNADDPLQVAAGLSQIRSESGGNPGIVQTVQDVNSGGNEAQGLLQVIPGTFAAYRDPSLPNDRTNPEANIAAALRYYRATYGSDLTQQWGHGHGYDSGGWLPPGYTNVYNGTGQPEAVFTPAQWQVLQNNMLTSHTDAQAGERIVAGTNIADGATIIIGDWDAHESANRRSANLLAAQSGI